MVEQKKGSRGRPPKSDAEAKRHPMGIRTTKDLKEKVEALAAANGRSVAAEIELRLEESIRREEQRGGRHISAPLDIIAGVMGMAEERTGQRWNEALSAWLPVEAVMKALLERNKPKVPDYEKFAAAEERHNIAYDRVAHDRGEWMGPDNPNASAKDRAEYEAASAELKRLAAPARKEILTGREIGGEALDLFGLKPHEPGEE